MNMLDFEQFLGPLSPDVPCGGDLVYEPDFIAMEQAGVGKAEQEFGDTIIPAEGPDWARVKELAQSLFSRTRDLRVAVYLSRALLHTDGFPGLRAGLDLIHGLLENFWEKVHPQLDPDDDNDPIMRINALGSLCDSHNMGRELREAPLVSSRAMGRFSLWDINVAAGKIPAPEGREEATVSTAEIDGAFLDCDEADLTATATAVTEAIEAYGAIQSCLSDKVGASQGIDPSAVISRLREINDILADKMHNRGLGGEVNGTAHTPEPDRADSAPAQTAVATAGDVINNRGDVVRLLDKMCQYFEKNEPSSPVPLLLKRAKRLAGMDFLAAIRDLAPDGVSQVEMIGGLEPED